MKYSLSISDFLEEIRDVIAHNGPERQAAVVRVGVGISWVWALGLLLLSHVTSRKSLSLWSLFPPWLNG